MEIKYLFSVTDVNSPVTKPVSEKPESSDCCIAVKTLEITQGWAP